jgi:hypothetical protein
MPVYVHRHVLLPSFISQIQDRAHAQYDREHRDEVCAAVPAARGVSLTHSCFVERGAELPAAATFIACCIILPLLTRYNGARRHRQGGGWMDIGDDPEDGLAVRTCVLGHFTAAWIAASRDGDQEDEEEGGEEDEDEEDAFDDDDDDDDDEDAFDLAGF